MMLSDWIKTLSPGKALRGWVLKCQQCGGIFWASRGDGLYCSKACKQKAYRERCIST